MVTISESTPSMVTMQGAVEPSELADSIADLRGSMIDGYDDERVNRVLGRISAATGLNLVCVWAFCDGLGVGGDSQFYVLSDEGRLYEVAGNLWRWLNDNPGQPGAQASPGHPDSWIGEPADFTADDLPYDDGWHNYALRDDHLGWRAGFSGRDCRTGFGTSAAESSVPDGVLRESLEAVARHPRAPVRVHVGAGHRVHVRVSGDAEQRPHLVFGYLPSGQARPGSGAPRPVHRPGGLPWAV
jgi:hypothetical protein